MRLVGLSESAARTSTRRRDYYLTVEWASPQTLRYSSLMVLTVAVAQLISLRVLNCFVGRGVPTVRYEVVGLVARLCHRNFGRRSRCRQCGGCPHGHAGDNGLLVGRVRGGASRACLDA